MPRRRGTAARRRPRCRRRHRRGRVHRSVDRLLPDRRRSAPARRGARARRRRLRRERAQRRLVLGAPVDGDGRHRPHATAATRRSRCSGRCTTTVDEVGRVVAAEGIDAHFAKGGTITLARTEAQDAPAGRRAGRGPLVRLRRRRPAPADRGGGRAALPGHGRADGAVHARTARRSTRCAWSTGSPPPRCAARRRIYEHTAVDGHRTPPRRRRRAASCGPTSSCWRRRRTARELRGRRRDAGAALLADDRHRSAQRRAVVSASASPSAQTFTDGRHMIIYGQRTADDRIAFGGRGAPYHFGSRIEPAFDTDDRVRGHARRHGPRAVPRPRRRRVPLPLGRTDRRAPRLVLRGALRPRGRDSPSPAATSATACRRPTSPAGRSPT